ncbi:multiple coagulation factor deficiency protein 2 homolog [Actinia tenebrosa]|uniref:Multiple coagulation factor deficiency protein 2 homolog n=1 Tax=Actinia tenebrosa TaxID=6105 RepID=A0A6P8H0E0_ACTTE|nr:multiple coagulation factor deficiency protein 2 homolog [Actinia tenebrosa]
MNLTGSNIFISLVIFSFGAYLITAHEEHQGSRLHDTKVTHDKEHIKEHLKDEIDVKDENLKEEDLQFHYFKLHDYDGNNKLDGIELMNAMTHYHDEEDNSTTTYTDDQLSSMIDQILGEDDTNKDGYIDYPEFIASQKS